MGRGATFNGIMELPLSFALRALFFLFNLASLSLSLLLPAGISFTFSVRHRANTR